MNAEHIAKALGRASRAGAEWKCLCPAHDDKAPSLSLCDEGGLVLWHCHAGCSQEAVHDALAARGLLNGHARAFGSPFRHGALGEPSQTWTYRYADGSTAFVVARYTKPGGGKDVRPWTPKGAGWESKAGPKPRPLYRLPELLTDRAKPVLVVEGEKCADAAAPMLPGYIVTTWAGGAKAVKDTDLAPLSGRRVVIWPDADTPGRDAAERIAERIRRAGTTVAILDVGERPAGWDVADAIAEGWTADDVVTFIEEYGGTELGTASTEADATAKRTAVPQIVGFREFLSTFKAPQWVVERVFQRGYVYALTAFWGHGKTAVMVTIALLVAAGRKVGRYRVARERVLFMCGENPEDVRMRVKLATAELGISWGELDGWLHFTEAPFGIDNPAALQAFIEENSGTGPFGLVVVDTGPAHSDAEEENANREMHALAMGLRKLLAAFGGPCVVVLMHPAKSATKDNMQPRGGGAFSGAIDGELCIWTDTGSNVAELYHRAKFRGPGFKPFAFQLAKREVSDVRDNFGTIAETVVALASDETPTPVAGKRRLRSSEKVALDALRSCLADGSGKVASVPTEVREAARMSGQLATLYDTWRAECYAVRISDSDNSDARQKAFKRAAQALQSAGIVAVHDEFVWLPKTP
jgi:hypothetical protein